MNRIFLLSGPVHSGKTTGITEWIRNRNSINGILQPLIDDRRYLKDISSGEIRLLELPADTSETDTISVGNYKFNNKVFSWANDKLLAGLNNRPDWLIIDEYGKLEMNDIGLEPAVGRILNELKHHQDTNIVIVIRDYLVADFLDKYGLKINDVENLAL